MKAFFAKISRRNWIIIGVVAAVLLLFVVLQARRNAAASTGAFETVVAQRGELTAIVGATGSVRSSQSAILNWDSSGTVDQVNAKVGDRVHKGDVLATLDPTSLPQSVILAESDLVSAQKALDDLQHSDTDRANAWVALQNAQDAYKKAYDYRVTLNDKVWLTRLTFRYINAHQIPIVHYVRGYADPETVAKADSDLALKKAQLDDAQRAYDRLKNGPNPADLAAAQAKVNAAQAAMDAARIIAPFDGVVTEAVPMPGEVIAGGVSSASAGQASSSDQSGASTQTPSSTQTSASGQTATATPSAASGQTTASSGQTVSAGQEAFRIDNLSNLLVDVQVSEVDINSVAVGQPATLSFDAVPEKNYQGKVITVSQAGETSSGAVNFTVTVQLTDADQYVKPGMTAAVNIIVNQVKDQLLVPNRAIRLVDTQRVVYILKNGRAQQVNVTLGASSDTSSVVIGGDLKAGDLIILNPPAQVGPGGGGGATFRGG